VEEIRSSVLAPLPQPSPPKSSSPLEKKLPVGLGQEDREEGQENVQTSYPHEKEGPKVGEDQTIVHAIGPPTPWYQEIPSAFSVALGQEDQEERQGQENQVVQKTHPFQVNGRQVETHPPSLLAPGPQKQDLQMEVGSRCQEASETNVSQTGLALQGQGQMGN